MGDAELERMCASLGSAGSPEEIFGKLVGTQAEMLESARRVFWQMARVVHPDVYQGTEDFEKAGSAFKRLMWLWTQAQMKIEDGTYGAADPTEKFEPFCIRASKQVYSIERLLDRGDLCALYVGSLMLDRVKTRNILKIPMKPGDNDLVANEARILGHLRASSDYKKLRHFVSQLVDAFAYQEEASGIVRQVNVLSYMEGLYSLKEVREVYDQGIDPKDMVWVWRRLLVALGFAHANKVIHGAVLPVHVLIHPGEHGVILIDWSYAVLDPSMTGERISAISSGYRAWYSAEVFAREEPTPGLDIAMAARCMIELLGGNPVKCIMPESVPWRLRSYLQGCTLPVARQRPQDVSVLLDEFDDLIEQLWGPRRFHELTMPER
jgi:hypothetical protein